MIRKLVRYVLPCLAILGLAAIAPAAESMPERLQLVVMDPLAAPLSCPCVEGYAQRKYEVLADYLTKQLGVPVGVSFGETLKGGIEKGQAGTAHIVIGKDSVVRANAPELALEVTPLARLTGKDGATTQTGLIVVRSVDPAKSVADLAGYRILYGPPACDEKFAAPRKLLEDAGIEVVAAEAAETSAACSDGACKIIEWGDSEKAAAVISSYAAPLLEGCGTIQKGELRVVAETAPVPFITAFATDKLPAALHEKLRQALLKVAGDADAMTALETLRGFVPLDEKLLDINVDEVFLHVPDHEPAVPSATGPEAVDSSKSQSWNGFRGPHRDAHAAWLPRALPTQLKPLWSVPLVQEGLGGIAATEQYVVLGDRDATDNLDLWRCLDAATGRQLWQVGYPALGRLDYGNSPRATPTIVDNRVITLGAFGHLTCIDLSTGAMLWQKSLRTDFGPTQETAWGTCASPLVIDGHVTVNPGSPQASLAALDLATGATVWQTPGGAEAYASFITSNIRGQTQIVGYDRTTLGGWDAQTGRRLWTHTPQAKGDFNVPTPVRVGERLLLATENNSTRMFDLAADGSPAGEPVGFVRDLAPDMSTPVVVGNRVFCVSDALWCLEMTDDGGLRIVYQAEEIAFGEYAPIIASEDRVLVVARGGELILLDPRADKFEPIARVQVFSGSPSEDEIYSHPALVGERLYLRGPVSLVCVDLGGRDR